MTSTVTYSLGHELHNLTADACHSAFYHLPSNENKWQWRMWMVTAYKHAHSPSQLAWFDGWWPHSAFII